MNNIAKTTFSTLSVLFSLSAIAADTAAPNKKIDASDPTRIVTFTGLGPRYTEYIDKTTITEAHLSLTMGLGLKDMMTLETGYGRYSGKYADHPSKTGMTATEFRYFHLFDMDYKVAKGYRGWGSSLQVNIAGTLPGTDGQNIVGLGASPAFAFGGGMVLYPIMMVMNSWDKHFGYYNGGGLNLSPMLAIKFNAWDGSFVNIWPQYTRYFWGDLGKMDAGGGQLRMVLGGKFSPTWVWRTIGFLPFDKNLMGYSHNGGFDPRGNYSALFRVEKYF